MELQADADCHVSPYFAEASGGVVQKMFWIGTAEPLAEGQVSKTFGRMMIQGSATEQFN
jgi:hypothetical protein